MKLMSQTESKPFRWLAARWIQLCLPRGTAAELGFHRFIFFSVMLAYSVTRQSEIASWASAAQVFWRPTFFFSLLHLPVLSEGMLAGCAWIWRLTLCLTAIGLFTRV